MIWYNMTNINKIAYRSSKPVWVIQPFNNVPDFGKHYQFCCAFNFLLNVGKKYNRKIIMLCDSLKKMQFETVSTPINITKLNARTI